MKKVFTVITVKHFGPAPTFNKLGETNYEVPGIGQEVVKNFRSDLPKGSSSVLRGFFVGENKTFIPVNLSSI